MHTNPCLHTYKGVKDRLGWRPRDELLKVNVMSVYHNTTTLSDMLAWQGDICTYAQTKTHTLTQLAHTFLKGTVKMNCKLYSQPKVGSVYEGLHTFTQTQFSIASLPICMLSTVGGTGQNQLEQRKNISPRCLHYNKYIYK